MEDLVLLIGTFIGTFLLVSDRSYRLHFGYSNEQESVSCASLKNTRRDAYLPHATTVESFLTRVVSGLRLPVLAEYPREVEFEDGPDADDSAYNIEKAMLPDLAYRLGLSIQVVLERQLLWQVGK